jgi:hypothetical protein
MCFGYLPCVTPLLKRLEGNKMKTPLISIHDATTTVLAASSDLLWHLLARRFRVASTCDELLDLFEERYSGREDTAPLSWSNLESGAAAVAVDLGPSGDKLSDPLARCFRLGRKADRLFVLSARYLGDLGGDFLETGTRWRSEVNSNCRYSSIRPSWRAIGPDRETRLELGNS